ncbi:hypothetical protein [Actinoplanes sp. NPDC026670]|uniref:hypothetical protein n=1 Tax=Actinoplanes sp. NPDC026670 TaxID=3154700 RepID=UPI0033C6C88C
MSSLRSRIATLAALTTASTVAAGTFAATPASAAAASVILVGSLDQISIFAGEGAQDADNTITVTPRSPGIAITDTDAGVRIVDDRGRCRQIDANTAHCDAAISLTVWLGDGNDSYTSSSTVPAVIYGGNGADTVQGGGGRDEVYTEDGVDVLRGGAGDDLLDGGDLGDVIEGQAGNDTMWGYENDTAYGGPGDDRFHEALGFTMDFYGDDGNDTVYSTRIEGGVHDFFGGAGFDTIDYSAWDRMVHVSLDGDDDDGERGVANCEAWFPWSCSSWRPRHNVHSDFENVVGSPQNDWIEGNGQGNVLSGQGGNDVVEGFAGNDTVDAGTGAGQTDQRVHGGDGNDVCRGSGVSSWPGCER